MLVKTALVTAALLSVLAPASSFANCKYNFGAVMTPDGRYNENGSLDQEGKDILEKKGYFEGSVYESDLVLFIRSQAGFYGWVFGTRATAVFKDVITEKEVAVGTGNFSMGTYIDVKSALEALPNCPDKE